MAQVNYRCRHCNSWDEKKRLNTTTVPDVPSQPTLESKSSGPLELEPARSPKPVGSHREHADALNCSKHGVSNLHAHLTLRILFSKTQQ